MLIKWKILVIGLPWPIIAFSIATVMLAVQKAQLNRDIRDANEKLDVLEDAWENANKPSTPGTTEITDGPPIDINYRLPDKLAPEHYNLHLHPDLNSFTFSGQVNITINVIDTTRTVVLHSHQLTISEISVTDNASSSSIKITNYELDTIREFLVIELDTYLVAKRSITLSIRFAGSMLNRIVGMYSSRYTKPDGAQKDIATSKFEPTYARQAFPCFDEPAKKATFTVTLVYPKDGGYRALSNMNAEDTRTYDQFAETTFNESVRMSTYLACFIVSDLVYESKTVETNGIGSNFDIRVFATSHQLDKVTFALDTAVAVTEFFIDYFRVQYPLPKLDMAAIPDFVSNAMEHWGLVTYRESVLLYDPEFSSATNIQKIATVVAHELAHMWFGNLVTMMWWNDLWLSEGFARYMEYKSINIIYPEWDMSNQFLIHALHSVMKYDSSTASHPIIQTVSTPDQITEIFDTISYEKGASVIRMLEDSVGTNKFQLAVQNYLIIYGYENAVTDDFLYVVDATGLDFDASQFMQTWTEQMGFPVVEVHKISDTEFRLTQKRFLANIEDYDIVRNDSPFNYTWSIPITYVESESPEVYRIWFEYDAQEVLLQFPTAPKWIKLNREQVGFYRVNYPRDLWQNLITALIDDPRIFPIADRAHLLNDAFALADASQLEYDIALDMTTYLQKETNYVPWSVASTKLLALQNILQYTDAYADFQSYGRELLQDVYDKVTWTVGKDHVVNRLRVTILTTACSLGHPECLAEASTRLMSWLSNPTDRPAPDLREIVYYYGMQVAGTENIWQQLWDVFKAELDASERSKLMYGLAGVRIPWILQRFIHLAWNENNVRRQDYFTCIQNIAANPAGEAIAWDYVRENWLAMVDRFGLNERFLGRMIPSITERFASETKLIEMQNFFAKYPQAGAGAASRKQALETVKSNIKWMVENKDDVAQWLRKRV